MITMRLSESAHGPVLIEETFRSPNLGAANCWSASMQLV